MCSERIEKSLTVLRVKQRHKVRAELYVLKREKSSVQLKRFMCLREKGIAWIVKGIET